MRCAPHQTQSSSFGIVPSAEPRLGLVFRWAAYILPRSFEFLPLLFPSRLWTPSWVPFLPFKQPYLAFCPLNRAPSSRISGDLLCFGTAHVHRSLRGVLGGLEPLQGLELDQLDELLLLYVYVYAVEFNQQHGEGLS